MDLYKHAFRLTPMIGSDLVADCFELAWDIRVLDMRAAPYDLTGVVLDPTGEPWTPVRIETPAGKREYADQQRHFAERAAPLRRSSPGSASGCSQQLSPAERTFAQVRRWANVRPVRGARCRRGPARRRSR